MSIYKGPKRRITTTSSKTGCVRAISRKTTGIVRRKGYIILPSTETQIKGYVNKAVKNGIIKNMDEIKTATAALTAGAVTSAKESNTKRVKVEHLKNGWQEYIKAKGIGNCPPHKCLLRSAVKRKQDLSEKNLMFNSISSELNEEF